MAVLNWCFLFLFFPLIPCLCLVRGVMLLSPVCNVRSLASFYSTKSSTECYPSIIGFFFLPSSFIALSRPV